jgi:hypothetical protein
MRKSQDFLKLQLEKSKQQKNTIEEALNLEIEALREKLENMGR